MTDAEKMIKFSNEFEIKEMFMIQYKDLVIDTISTAYCSPS